MKTQNAIHGRGLWRRFGTLLVMAGLVVGGSELLAATRTWDGGPSGTGIALNDATNWSSDIAPTSTSSSSDTAAWNGTVPGDLWLTNNDSALGGPSGTYGLTLSLAATQTNNVTLLGAAFRLYAVSIAAGAGALTCAGNDLTISGGSTTTISLANNSTNLATLNGMGTGGGGPRTLAVSGSGNWAFNGIIKNVNGGLAISKSGTGTLTVSGINQNSIANTISEGVLVANNASALGTGTTTIGGGSVNAQLRLVGLPYAITPFILGGRPWGATYAAHIYNASGNSSLLGTLSLNTGGAEYAIESAAGTLTLGTLVKGTATGGRNVYLQGAGNGAIGAIDAANALDISLIKRGTGTWTLTGVNGCDGYITVSAGTLALGSGGSLSNAPVISIAAGATFDASAQSSFALSSSNAIYASGTGTAVGSNAATIKGGSVVAFGTQPITLDYDGAHPALFVSQGTLSLAGNTFNVNTPAPLPAGDYVIVQQASGSIASSGTHSEAGTAIGDGRGFIIVNGATVVLRIITATRISIETAADGSGTIVPAQSLTAGGSLTVYAIARAADGTFVKNVPAIWSLLNSFGGVASGDLVPVGDGRSAIFTGHSVGSAAIRANWSGLTSAAAATPVLTGVQAAGPESFALTGLGSSNQSYYVLANADLGATRSDWWLLGSTLAAADGTIQFLDLQATNTQQFYCFGVPPATDSGSLTVVPSAATQISVETAPDGSGVVLPARSLVPGFELTVYAVTRDVWGNFVSNALAASWALINLSGGVANTDLSPTSGPNAAFTGHGAGTGQIRASLSGLTSVDSGLITVLPSITVVWSSTPANYLWDTTSLNWIGGSGRFENGDPVQFTDAGAALSPIVLVGALSPGAITVDVSTNHYVFAGNGSINGTASLSKNGAGVLTFSNTTPNSYSGGTFVNAGTLDIATTNCFALANPSPITVADGATLLINISGPATWSNNVSGAGRWLVGTGTGSQTTVLRGDYSAFSGTIEVAVGNAKIQLPTSTRYPSAGATLRLDSGQTAYLTGGGSFPAAIQLHGGTTGEALGQLRFGGTSGCNVGGPVTLFADATIGVDSGNTASLSGAINGNYGLTKVSAGTLKLWSPATYTGNTVVSGGVLFVDGPLGNPASTVTVSGGTLGGNGTILSPVQVLSDGVLAPSAAVTSCYTLTISNDLTLAGQTTMRVKSSDLTSDAVVVSGKITFGGTLVLNNTSGTLRMGDCFTLFQAGSYAGSFSSVSPSTPGSGLVWDLSSLAVDGTVMVMGSSVKTDTMSYAGYTIKSRSRFNAYNSLVNRAYPLYDYSVNVLKIGSSYMAVTGDRYIGSGEDGDHIFGWTSSAGQPGTWSNIKGGSGPLFLKSDAFGANTMDAEMIFNPANNTWYMYVQKQISSGDQIMGLTSTDRKNWTAYKSRSVIINIPSSTPYFNHEEVIYVPWSSNPFWMYVAIGTTSGYKLIKSDDPLTFDYDAQIDCGGERNFGGQRGYLQEAPNGPLFLRITSGASGSSDVPIIQFSSNGTGWTYSDHLTLMGSSNTGNYSNCYFPGISTINGNGALEYLGHNRWRAIYAASTSAAPTSPEIFYSEIGCGEVVIELQ